MKTTPREPVQLRTLKKGAFFTKKDLIYPADEQVWIKGAYDRASKRYSCIRFSDINDEQFMPANKKVFDPVYF